MKVIYELGSPSLQGKAKALGTAQHRKERELWAGRTEGYKIMNGGEKADQGMMRLPSTP